MPMAFRIDGCLPGFQSQTRHHIEVEPDPGVPVESGALVELPDGALVD